MNQDGLSNFAEGPVACLPSPFLYPLTRHEGSPSAAGFPSRPVDDAVKPVNECFSKKMAHGGSNMLEHSQATDPAQFLGQHSSKTICLLQTFCALCSDLWIFLSANGLLVKFLQRLCKADHSGNEVVLDLERWDISNGFVGSAPQESAFALPGLKFKSTH